MAGLRAPGLDPATLSLRACAALGAGAAGRDDRDRRRVRGLGPPRHARPPGTIPFWETWVRSAAYAGAAAVCGARAVLVPTERRAWAAMAAALASYTAGYVGFGIVYSDGAVPYVSFADALWLGFYPLRLRRARPARARPRPPLPRAACGSTAWSPASPWRRSAPRSSSTRSSGDRRRAADGRGERSPTRSPTCCCSLLVAGVFGAARAGAPAARGCCSAPASRSSRRRRHLPRPGRATAPTSPGTSARRRRGRRRRPAGPRRLAAARRTASPAGAGALLAIPSAVHARRARRPLGPALGDRPPSAVVLAAGRGRRVASAGPLLTFREVRQLAETPPPGAHRRPHRPAQPPRLLRRLDAEIAARRAGAASLLDRPRPLQGAQRHARPPRRRPAAAQARRRAWRARRAPRATCSPASAATSSPSAARRRRRRGGARRGRAPARALEEPFVLDGIPVQVDASIGIALFPEHAADAVELLQRADVAMYQAKRDRTGVAVYRARARRAQPRPPRARSASCAPAIAARRARAALPAAGRPRHRRAAAASRRSCAGSTRRTGCSPPGAFLPSVEQTSLMRPLTERVVARRPRPQAAAWRARPLDVPSPSTSRAPNLLDVGFPATVARLLRDAGIAPDRPAHRDHRERGHGRHASARSACSTRLRALGVAARRSTTSAPATRRSPPQAPAGRRAEDRQGLRLAHGRGRPRRRDRRGGRRRSASALGLRGRRRGRRDAGRAGTACATSAATTRRASSSAGRCRRTTSSAWVAAAASSARSPPSATSATPSRSDAAARGQIARSSAVTAAATTTQLTPSAGAPRDSRRPRRRPCPRPTASSLAVGERLGHDERGEQRRERAGSRRREPQRQLAAAERERADAP